MSSAVIVAMLVAAGVYLVMQRGLVRVTFGFVLLGHAANVILLAAGGTGRREAPLLGQTDAADAADPLPQAFALTAIVIAFAVTVYLLGLASSGGDAEVGEPDEPGEPSEPAADHAVADEPGAAGSGRRDAKADQEAQVRHA